MRFSRPISPNPALRVLALCLPLILTVTNGLATEFYVDPVSGSADGDGSAESPWKTLQEVVESGQFASRSAQAPIKPGDTVYLRTGYHGEFRVLGGHNEQPITIAAEPGHQPRLRAVAVRGGSKWIFRGLSISPSHAPVFEKKTLVSFASHPQHGQSSDIVIEDCELFTAPDISNWSAQDWREKAANGINVNATNCRVIGNQIRNIRFGLLVNADHAFVSNNRILNFSGDAIRGLSDYSTYEYNYIANAYKVDKNHDDGFQSWSVGDNGVGTGVVRGVTLRGNTFINNLDPNQPLRSSFQGIGCFDGMFEDWVIENNVVCVNHYHGITLMGAKNCRIVNNTVIDMFEKGAGPSWIRISAHKNGTPSSGNLVSNNLANAFSIERAGVRMTHNKIVNNPKKFFVDPEAFDFRLRRKSPAIDKADPDTASRIDIEQQARDDEPDLGAHEYRE